MCLHGQCKLASSLKRSLNKKLQIKASQVVSSLFWFEKSIISLSFNNYYTITMNIIPLFKLQLVFVHANKD